jgi:glutamate carboxypeptidase
VRLGGQLVSDIRHAQHAPGIPAPRFHFDFDTQLIAGNHRAPEPGAVNPREQDQFAIPVFHFREQEHATRLRHGFDHQHPRHDRSAGKVSGEKRLIDGDILDRHNPLSALKFEHAIDQQKRKPVRQNMQDAVDVQGALCRRWSFAGGMCGVTHASLIKSEDYTVRRAPKSAFKKHPIMPKKALQRKSTVPASSGELQTRLRYFEERQEQIIQTVRQLVEIESPSDNKEGVDRLGSLLAGRFEGLGGHAKFHRTQGFGDHLQVDFSGKKSGKPIMLLGHLDTVYPLGTLSTMPFRQADGRLWGPGSFDMKSGIAFMLHAIEALRSWHEDQLPQPVTILLVSDEEVGSDTSRRITESLAQKSAAVLVLEPSHGPKGAVKTARKGVGEYVLKVIGKAAHSGLDFEKGQSAIVELSRQIIEIAKLVDLKKGITLNIGTVQGGTRSNVIPAEASAVLDVRVPRAKDAAGIDRKLRSLKPFNRACKLEIKGGVNRPPMERTPGVIALYEKASAIAKQLGWKLEEAAVGGGSDGNFTAGLGVPTLDGLGAVGEGAHATHESVLISELPRRTALIAELIEKV